jgi:hypothetical protein
MATYDLNRSELNSLLASDHIDPSVRKSIIDYLQDDGLLTGHGSTVAVQESGYQSGNPATLDPTAQVLFVDTSPISVGTDPALKVIVDTADANLIVTGTTDVFVAMAATQSTCRAHPETMWS